MDSPKPRAGRFEVDHALLYRGARAVDPADPHPGWGNLGDWTATDDYATAARRLAERLWTAARVTPGARVVDAGCGWGELAVELARACEVAHVTAIDPEPAHVAAARARVETLGLADRIDVRAGDATRLEGVADASIDAVLALDAAYHFDPRRDFLAEAARVLRPGGRVAWTDLVLRRRPTARAGRAAWQAVARRMDWPAANVVDREGILAELRAAGLRVDPPEDLSRAVLGGFARFGARQLARQAWRSPAAGWAKIGAAAVGAGVFASTGLVDYVLFAATAPAS